MWTSPQKIGQWDSGSIIEIMLRYCIIKEIAILYCIVNIFKMPIPLGYIREIPSYVDRDLEN